MKASQAWHRTPAGRVVCFLGSVQLAIPVLVVVAAALAWGTYLESTQSTKIARAAVYGSWWFMGLMGLVSVSLVFAVVTRYPWKRKHIGFITVHAGLILLILGGFWSLFGRVEGHLTLEEGASGDAIELDEDAVDLVEMNAGAMKTVASVAAPMGATRLSLDGVGVEVLERWANAKEEQYVADNGSRPYRAIEVALNPTATVGTWVGDEMVSGSPAVIEGLVVRVLPDGSTWEPPAGGGAEESGYAFVVGASRYTVGEEGKEVFPGWKIESIKRFTHATVSSGTISEASDGSENPAIEVVITDGHGTRERHTAFMKFPEMIMGRTLEGEGHSGARLLGGGEKAGAEALVIYGSVAEPRVGYVAPDGSGVKIEQTGPLPWTFTAGTRKVRILQQFAHAQNASRFTKAPAGAETRPALVVRPAGASESSVLAWKGFAVVPGGGRNLVLRYGPRTAPLPFKVTLKDFRKTDYPGTEMAMAYESDVTITRQSGEEAAYRIYMNNPYAHRPWKVYQSGFVGDHVSVFSVMKDPGIPLTYAGSIVLCVGLVLTFYARSLSWGHPGIPIGIMKKEPAHEAAADSVGGPAVRPVAPAELEGAGVA